MTTPKKSLKLAILMPVYEDRDAFKMLIADLKDKIKTPFRVFAIEDGSLKTPLMLADLKAADVSGDIVYLKRNMGHQRAIATGLNYLNTYYDPAHTIVMDSDGEDKAESIPTLLGAFKDDNTDVVVASRKSRVETLQFKTFYVIYKLIFSILTGRVVNFGNFMAMNRQALSRICAMNELWLHFAGAVILSRLRLKTLSLDRGKRFEGQSKMNFSGLVLHGMRAVMVFTEDVLVRVGVACFMLIIGVIGAIFTAIILKVNGTAAPGWFTNAVGLLLVILFQVSFLVLFLLLINGSSKSKAPMPTENIDRLIDRVEKAGR